MMKYLSVVSVLTIAPTAAPTMAAVFSDDFNSYAANDNLILTDGWAEYSTLHATAQGFRAAGEESPFTAVANGLSGRYFDANTGSQGGGDGVAALVSGLDPASPVVVEFDFKLAPDPTTSVFDHDVTFGAAAGSTGPTIGSFLHLFYLSGGDRYLANRTPTNTYEVYTDAPVAVGQWYHLELVFAPIENAADTYTLTYTDPLGNTTTHADIPFRVNLATAIQQFNLWNSSGSAATVGEIYVDNFTVAVPEPAGLGLLGAGTMLLIPRRRK